MDGVHAFLSSGTSARLHVRTFGDPTISAEGSGCYSSHTHFWSDCDTSDNAFRHLEAEWYREPNGIYISPFIRLHGLTLCHAFGHFAAVTELADHPWCQNAFAIFCDVQFRFVIGAPELPIFRRSAAADHNSNIGLVVGFCPVCGPYDGLQLSHLARCTTRNISDWD